MKETKWVLLVYHVHKIKITKKLLKLYLISVKFNIIIIE